MNLNYSADELPALLGNTIRQYRTSLDMSQEMLAERSELTSTYIGKLERGTTNPTVATLYKITTALGITLTQLFEEISDPEQSEEAPELYRFNQYLKNLPPERIATIHSFIEQLDS